MRMELEERPSFFKALAGDFSQQLRIPSAFVKNFNGRVPRMCGLRGPCGKCWAVELEEIENRLVFHNGWQRFLKHHFLEVGDFLTFTYDGVSTFDVIIYGKSYCEKNVEAAQSRIGSVVYRTSNHVISGKKPALDLEEETSIGSIPFKSGNPFFTTTFTKCIRYDMRVPRSVVIAAGLMSNVTITLQDPAGRSQSVKLTEASRGQLCMLEGWSKCCKENQISFGDTLVVEVVKKSVFQLHIFKSKSSPDVEILS